MLEVPDLLSANVCAWTQTTFSQERQEMSLEILSGFEASLSVDLN